MTDFGSSNSTPNDAPIDLAAFGFDQASDAWLDTFRDARQIEPLGRVGDYEFIAEIGRGGQGIVYKARCIHGDRIVAIKRLIGGKFAAADLRRRFEREMQAIASLDHPNITRAIDVDIIDGHPVIVMEWVEGESLSAWARSDGMRRPADEIVALFTRVCDAVQHAHIRGVIHRDLKPSNVLIETRRRGDARTCRPVILDFGMARILKTSAMGSDATTTGRFLGTIAYAAPEQLNGDSQQADALADVYALGVMLYEALAGRHPHLVAGSLGETIRAIQDRMPERLTQKTPGVSRDLDAIIFKALSKTPGDRYQSVDALAADLRRHLAGDPVMARSPGTLYLAGKLIRRHPVAFVVGLSMFVVVSALATGLYVASAREKAALHVARTTSEFLAKTLAAAEPDRKGADVTLLEVLAQAGHRAERELADTPEAAAQVHLAIGKTYNALWRWREAIPHLEMATRLIAALPDRDDEVYAQSLTSLGRAYTSTRNPQAVSTQQEALSLRRQLFVEPDARIAESLKELAYALQQAAEPPQWEAAEEYYNKAIAMFRATSGPDDRETASCLHNFGWMRVRQRRYADAVELYRQTIEIFRRTNRRDDPFYAECLVGYTAQLSRLGRDAENLDVVNELIPLIRASHGSSEIGDLLWARADILTRLHRVDEADDAYREAFVAFFEWCRLPAPPGEDDADRLCDELLDRIPALPGEKIKPALTFIGDFVGSRIRAGQYERAIVMLDRIESALSQYAPDADLIRASILEDRAEIASARGDRRLAERLLRNAIEAADRPGIAFDRKRAWIERQLAVSQIGSPVGDEDLQRLESVCRRLAESCGEEHHQTVETRRLIERLNPAATP